MLELNGFVFIIESPTASDILDGRTEGRVFSEFLRIAEIPHWYSLAVDKKMVSEALENRLAEAWKNYGRLPILHLSMHGNADGISLTSGEFMFWAELRSYLLPLIRALQGSLLACMSSCFGSAGCRMAIYLDNEPCFWALAGNKGSATWADAAIAYSSFYHLFFKRFPLDTCVNSRCVASGDHNFTVHSGQHTKAVWQEFINTHVLHSLRRLFRLLPNRHKRNSHDAGGVPPNNSSQQTRFTHRETHDPLADAQTLTL